jgi:hypothetical protein
MGRTADKNHYRGHLHPTTGPPFDSEPFDPNEIDGSYAGPFSVKFLDGNDAIFEYTVDDVTQVKQISQFVFREHPSQCSKIEGVYGWSFHHERHGDNFLPYHYSIVDSPEHLVRWGSHSQRFEERFGDCYGSDCDRSDGTRERSELAQNGNQNYEGDEFWYGLSFYAPLESEGVTGYVNYFQFTPRPSPDENRDLLYLMFRKLERGDFVMYKLPPDSPGRNLGSLIPENKFYGNWHDIVMQVRWSKADDGFFRVWVNGHQKINHNGFTITKQADQENTYFKYGIYRPTTKETSVVYFDELRRGRSREEVDIRMIEKLGNDVQ